MKMQEVEYENVHLRHPVIAGGEEESNNYRNRGNICLKKGDLGTAEKLYGMALGAASSVKQYALGFSNRAEVRLRMQKYEAAAADADRAAELDPTNVKSYYRLGQAHRHLNNKVAALKAYGSALSLRPCDKEILKAMQICSEPDAKETNEADEPHEEVTELDDEVVDITDNSLISPATGGQKEKEEQKQKAKEIESDDDEVIDIPSNNYSEDNSPTGDSIANRFQSNDPLVDDLKEKLRLLERHPDTEEEDVIDITKDNESLVTAEYVQPSPEVIAANKKKAMLLIGRKKVNKKNKSINEMYKYFQDINDDISDDEDVERVMLRDAAETVDPELISQAKKVFSAFDKDGNGYWSYEEAALAAQTLENRELTERDFNIRCEEYGSDRSMGWASTDLINMYTSSSANVVGLQQHLAIVNQQERKKGVQIHTYSPDEHVEVFINNLWKKGTVYGEGTEPDSYDIIWHNGEGTLNVPANCLRKLFVGWGGDEEGAPAKKKIAAGQYLDPSTGLLAPIAAGSTSVREKPSAEEMDKWGSNLVSDLPAKSDLPEEPVHRLCATVEMTGMGDEGGMLDREKVRGMLNLRKRAG
eukprot:TRINITY_DN21699_c0_g1_i1.p1 TRINITY_DN21699_c0_g1~~TRINITY_DN21699_c0_g1_i1.p1  ORF type:complete len:586 (+),score=163.02 TRINITY_DN21699_c0_g1_i1:73-1830(+)